MNLHEMDVVYIVKPSNANEELRHSLRSVAANLPHRRVVIAGHKPDWVKNVLHIPTLQQNPSKYLNAEENWQAAMNSAGVSDDFILFNDDFFVMHPITEIPAAHRGDLDDVIAYYSNIPSAYLSNMQATKEVLNKLAFTDLKSYALHIPMVMNKERRKLLQAIVALANPMHLDTQMRTLYGNFWRVGGVQMDDVKVNGVGDKFNTKSTFLSTSDQSFRRGEIGKFIRERFNTKCKYEV